MIRSKYLGSWIFGYPRPHLLQEGKHIAHNLYIYKWSFWSQMTVNRLGNEQAYKFVLITFNLYSYNWNRSFLTFLRTKNGQQTAVKLQSRSLTFDFKHFIDILAQKKHRMKFRMQNVQFCLTMGLSFAYQVTRLFPLLVYVIRSSCNCALQEY